MMRPSDRFHKHIVTVDFCECVAADKIHHMNLLRMKKQNNFDKIDIVAGIAAVLLETCQGFMQPIEFRRTECSNVTVFHKFYTGD